MVVAKISSPPCPKDGVIDAWALEELRLDSCLLKRTMTRTSRKKCPKIIARKQKNTTTHRRVSRAASSSSSSSPLSNSTSVPSEKRESTWLRTRTNNKEDKKY
jgi:hypothetical protein